MKAHFAKVSLALLSTVFLLGCQEQGSGPVGPEGLGPEFTHKDDLPHGMNGGGGGGGGNVTGNFTAVLQGQVTSVGNVILIGRQTQLTTGETHATLDLTFFRSVKDDWNTCFESGPANQFTGPLGVNFDKQDPGDVLINFNFDGKGTNGIVVVRYGLRLRGVIQEPANWPALDGDPSRIRLTTYDMEHERGPGKAVACTGRVDAPGTLTTMDVSTS